MADIEFRIGGKDDTGKAIASATKGLSRLELSFGQIVKAAGGFAAVNAAINLVTGSFSKLAGFVATGVKDFDRAQEAIRALSKAMELNGGTTDEAIARNIELADALELRTNVEAEAVAELMKSAAMLGVQNDQLGEVAKTAIGLSEAMGISLEDGLKKARLATEGNFNSFNKLIPSMKDMATNEEKLAAVMDLANKGLAQKEDSANSAAGAYQRMMHKVGTMIETVGEALSPFRKLAFDGIGFLADKITELLVPAVASIGPAVEFAGKMVEWLQGAAVASINGIIRAFTFVEVVVENFGTVFEAMVTSAHLQFVTLADMARHALTVQIPAYAAWFADNFVNLMRDAFNATVTIAANLGEKIVNILSRIWEYISSGMEGGFSQLSSDIGKLAAGSLLEGFEATTAALPEIAARAITDKEKELTGKLAGLGGRLGDEFNKKLAGRLIGVEEKLGADAGPIALKMEAGKGDVGGESAIDKALGGGGGGGGSLTASTGRLLTRGAGSDIPDLLRKLIDATKDVGLAASAQAMAAESAQRIAQENNAAINSALANSPKLAPALQ